MVTLQHEQGIIAELARRHLTIAEEEVVVEYLLNNRTNDALRCLLGKVDLRWGNDEIGNQEVLLIYRQLGIKPKDCFLKARL
jgi:hypothetical protein